MDNHYQLSRIHNYINGLMTREEMHALEREALEDPFLQDAIDGYTLQNGVDAVQLSLLQKRLANRVEQYADRRDRRFFGWQRLAIGATAAVMFLTVCILLLIKYLPNTTKSTLTEVEILQEISYHAQLVEQQSEGEPRDGWNDYQRYLDRHFTNAAQRQGLVHLSFAVNNEGIPVDIVETTTQGIHPADVELQQILEQGPKWSGNKGQITLDIKKVSQ